MPKNKKVSVKIELPDYIIFDLMLMAHEQDITFNKLCENILRAQIKQLEKEHGKI